LNVLNSDGTLYFNVKDTDKGGFRATKAAANKYGKPFLAVNENVNPHAIRQWLVENDIKTLNIAGNRGSSLTTSQANKIKKSIVEVLTGKEHEVFAGTALSTHSKPIKIFTDGSGGVKTANMGYGAYFKYNGKDYNLSGNRVDVNRILEAFEGEEYSNPTMELLGVLETLKKFEDTAEHLYILTDIANTPNYQGLWERSTVNQYHNEATGTSKKSFKPFKPNSKGNAPYMQFMVDEIMDRVDKIEEAGGSVRFQWIPANHGSYAKKAQDNAEAFNDKQGVLSNDLVEQYAHGNKMADALAGDLVRKSNFKSLGAPEKEAISRIEQKAIEEVKKRTEDNKEIC